MQYRNSVVSKVLRCRNGRILPPPIRLTAVCSSLTLGGKSLTVRCSSIPAYQHPSQSAAWGWPPHRCTSRRLWSSISRSCIQSGSRFDHPPSPAFSRERAHVMSRFLPPPELGTPRHPADRASPRTRFLFPPTDRFSTLARGTFEDRTMRTDRHLDERGRRRLGIRPANWSTSPVATGATATMSPFRQLEYTAAQHRLTP